MKWGTSMAGKKFLHPLLKMVLCVVGILTMGYFLHHSFEQGTWTEWTNFVRGLVFLGFAYLLVQSIRDFASRFR
jgi:hypothetical protein